MMKIAGIVGVKKLDNGVPFHMWNQCKRHFPVSQTHVVKIHLTF